MIKDNIQIRIIDMNKFDIDHETVFNINSEIFEELNKHIEFFRERGMNFTLSKIKILDPTRFYKWIIERLYPQYKVEDHQKDGSGIPDFRLEKLEEEKWLEKCREHPIYNIEIKHFEQDRTWQSNRFSGLPQEIWIEVKKNGDGLHANQFNWILKNRDKTNIKILFIKEDDPNGY